jgi:hypothetical protein
MADTEVVMIGLPDNGGYPLLSNNHHDCGIANLVSDNIFWQEISDGVPILVWYSESDGRYYSSKKVSDVKKGSKVFPVSVTVAKECLKGIRKGICIFSIIGDSKEEFTLRVQFGEKQFTHSSVQGEGDYFTPHNISVSGAPATDSHMMIGLPDNGDDPLLSNNHHDCGIANLVDGNIFWQKISKDDTFWLWYSEGRYYISKKVSDVDEGSEVFPVTMPVAKECLEGIGKDICSLSIIDDTDDGFRLLAEFYEKEYRSKLFVPSK